MFMNKIKKNYPIEKNEQRCEQTIPEVSSVAHKEMFSHTNNQVTKN
jgi:hypothetical protein